MFLWIVFRGTRASHLVYKIKVQKKNPGRCRDIPILYSLHVLLVLLHYKNFRRYRFRNELSIPKVNAFL